MSEEMKTYGQIAYEAHAEIAGRLDPGQAFPAWEDLDAGTMNAWMASGRAVDEQVRTDGIAPPPAGDALAQLAASWETEVASIRNAYECDPVEMVRDCARQLRDLIGGGQ